MLSLRRAACSWRLLTSLRAAVTCARASGRRRAAARPVEPIRARRSRATADTVADASQLTGVRVDLPKPDCAVRPSDCADIDVLNTLDGFNLQPRISIPFTGAIDPRASRARTSSSSGSRTFAVTGINQIVWEPAANTLHVESDQLLEQHTRYVLVVTTDVRDAAGKKIEHPRS